MLAGLCSCNIPQFQISSTVQCTCSTKIMKLVGSGQSYCSNNQAYFFGPPCTVLVSYLPCRAYMQNTVFVRECKIVYMYDVISYIVVDLGVGPWPCGFWPQGHILSSWPCILSNNCRKILNSIKITVLRIVL